MVGREVQCDEGMGRRQTGYVDDLMIFRISSIIHYEFRLKESMKMMGLPNWIHWLAWFLKSFFFFLLIIVLQVSHPSITILIIILRSNPAYGRYKCGIPQSSSLGPLIFLTTPFQTALLTLGGIFEYTGMLVVFITLLMYVVATICSLFLLSVFFFNR